MLVAKGKKTLKFEPRKNSFDPAGLRAAAIGPSGNLRAPTLKLGKTWIVGYSADAYADKLGG